MIIKHFEIGPRQSGKTTRLLEAVQNATTAHKVIFNEGYRHDVVVNGLIYANELFRWEYYLIPLPLAECSIFFDDFMFMDSDSLKSVLEFIDDTHAELYMYSTYNPKAQLSGIFPKIKLKFDAKH